MATRSVSFASNRSLVETLKVFFRVMCVAEGRTSATGFARRGSFAHQHFFLKKKDMERESMNETDLLREMRRGRGRKRGLDRVS